MIRTALLLLTLLVPAVTLPGAAWAQTAQAPQAALLVADEVYLGGDDRLVAEGNVEALYEGRRLRARSITYDRTAERLIIEGPITLTDPDSGTTTLADAGELDRDMQNGILRGARIVMDGHVQLAAHQLARVNGRYSQLYKASVTSCRICTDGSPPLWQIRARRMIHDTQERQLYFDDAQLRVLDVPVLYIPRLRLPDPTLERATGFLIPSLHNSTLLGAGIEVPYFIAIGDHRDLTLTPFLTTKSTTLQYRYRQAFRTGTIEIEGAVSDDNLGLRSTRAYVFAKGAFDLPQDFKLSFNIEVVNDDTYLLDYGFSGKDRLRSNLVVDRARRDDYIRGEVTHFRSIRAGESNATLPSIIGNVDYERRLFPRALGGELRLSASAHSHFRRSDLITDGPDFDRFADGRDVTRLTGSADWRRNWILPRGVVASVQTGLALDGFAINEAGTTSRSSASQITPSAGVQLRWPLIKSGRGGTHVLEPVVQLGWIGGRNPAIPNDENTRIEFDEGNLFAFSRFVAPDRRERGLSAAYGVTWTRLDKAGWQSRLAIGRVIRDDPETESDGSPSFSNSSGLQDKDSDLLIAGQFKTPNGVTFTARSLFDDAFDTTKAEARASWKNARADFGATYIWLGGDSLENRPNTVSEWAFDGSYRLSRHWTGSADWRYDVATDRSVRAGLGLSYTNECVEIALSASRRFTSSTILEPSTSVSLTVGLRGFTTKSNNKSYTRTCRN